jgi:hypothetical protein
MDNLQAGLAALAVIGAIRGVFIIGAAFVEGLGVLAIVLGILSLVL